MAPCTTLSLLLLLVLISAAVAATDMPSETHDLDIAIEEMATANYFTFITLINMSPLDHAILGNVTFLMPNDRILSKTSIPQDSVSDFLLRHSIPSPLLFDHLQHIPSGSTIPSSEPEYILNIDNRGRRSFFLNNVKIISPNICTAGSSIRCHGIDGVLSPITKNTVPTGCSNATRTPAVVTTPRAPSSPAPRAPPVGDPNQIPVAAPKLVGPKKSGSCMSHERSLKFIVTFVISIMAFNM
ncbi:hypothetical protein P3X46_005218 [Hevea brasiliensis]|uniref:FAS1 domain-containing protein n=1 Tax=Hevea brasiliensis TaxID=3981 RepID=A0ABQ9N1M3_HEVBR|nr:FAS1 domain-containing protein SELMODRAFT_448915 [Hevea brasiliensis]KAJ9185607.1 hypothetical protein P3X46_005218 [Hevea brasiliensis]